MKYLITLLISCLLFNYSFSQGDDNKKKKDRIKLKVNSDIHPNNKCSTFGDIETVITVANLDQYVEMDDQGHYSLPPFINPIYLSLFLDGQNIFETEAISKFMRLGGEDNLFESYMSIPAHALCQYINIKDSIINLDICLSMKGIEIENIEDYLSEKGNIFDSDYIFESTNCIEIRYCCPTNKTEDITSIEYVDEHTTNENLIHGELKVYPNSFVDHINIVSDRSYDDVYNVRLISINYKRIYNLNNYFMLGDKFKVHIPLSIPKGIYLLQIIGKNQNNSILVNKL